MTTESDLYQAALGLITEFGGTGTYKSVKVGPSIPGQVPADIVVSQSAKMVLLDLTLQSNGMSLKYGTQIKTGDKEAYVLPPARYGGQPINVNPGTDKVIFGGVEYTVVTYKEINPTGANPLVLFLYLRR